MIVIASILSVAVFVVAFKVTGIYSIALDAVTSVRKATGVIMDDSMDDNKKEILLKESSIHLLKRFVQITILAILILSLPVLVLLVFDALSIAPFQDVVDFLLRWEVILVTTVVVITASVIHR
jgi:hypothetical protein